MGWTFGRRLCCVVALAVGGLHATGASAVTLSYEYSGVGSANFQSETILNLGGSCASPCIISAVLSMSGTGPSASVTSGWAGQASATILDNLGDNLHLAVNAGSVGTNHPINGGVLFPSVSPNTLDISTMSLASFLGGSGTIDYSIDIGLPPGLYVTPLPESLPLYMTGLAVLGLIIWRQGRQAQLV